MDRRGKEAAQKRAVDSSRGEILVFSDVGTILKPNGISNIVKSFYDPTVGCVSSVDSFMNAKGEISGEGSYVRYEMFVRDLETKVNTLVGLSGSFFAARREVCQNWVVGLQSDLNTLFNAVKMGLRGVSDSASVGYYKNLLDERKEFDRKVRTVLRGISVVMSSLPLFNPFQYGLFSWQLFSHKVCRWLVPLFLIIMFVCNVFLIFHSPLYSASMTFQLIFYAVGLGGLWIDYSKYQSLKIPFFFIIVNLSILKAWYQYLRGERLVRWESSKR